MDESDLFGDMDGENEDGRLEELNADEKMEEEPHLCTVCSMLVVHLTGSHRNHREAAPPQVRVPESGKS
jgi:hypothetical protein